MKNYICVLIVGLFVMACVPLPAAPTIDIGDQVAYVVDNQTDLQALPVLSTVDLLGYKCAPGIYIDSKILMPEISKMIKDPPKLYYCGVAIGAEAEKTILRQALDIWNKYGGEIAGILLALFTLSEALAGSKLQANSIWQLIKGWIKKKAKPIT